jgi:hypothetical protein
MGLLVVAAAEIYDQALVFTGNGRLRVASYLRQPNKPHYVWTLPKAMRTILQYDALVNLLWASRLRAEHGC